MRGIQKWEDVAAVVAYLTRLKPMKSGSPVAVRDTPAMSASTAWMPAPAGRDGPGARIFEGACASCHRWDGAGQEIANAALRGIRSVNDASGANVVRVILRGSSLATAAGPIAMPAFADGYSDVEIAAVSNYVLAHFGNVTGAVSVSIGVQN